MGRKPKDVDWELVERLWRAGVTAPQISAQLRARGEELTPEAIRKARERLGWPIHERKPTLSHAEIGAVAANHGEPLPDDFDFASDMHRLVEAESQISIASRLGAGDPAIMIKVGLALATITRESVNLKRAKMQSDAIAIGAKVRREADTSDPGLAMLIDISSRR